MRGEQLTLGAAYGVVFDDGEDFYTALGAFCRSRNIRQGYIPMFLGGFTTVEIAGDCADGSCTTVDRSQVAMVGAGTIAYEPFSDTVVPHVHVSVGRTGHGGATARTSHLVSAQVRDLNELLLIEVAYPLLQRHRG
jgi:predicted DNA-binding protein with PD1-like motif